MQPPSFDTWTTIFLFAAIQGIFVALVLLVLKKENRFNNLMIALLILLFSITLIEYVMYWTRFQIEYPHFMAISTAFPFLTGVFLYLYFCKIFENLKWTSLKWIHFIPFIIAVVIYLPVYLSTAETKLLWIQGVRAEPSFFTWPEIVHQIRWSLPWLSIVHMLYYAGLIFYKFHAFSRTEREVATWFNWLIGLYLFYILSFTSYFVLVNFPFFNSQWDYMISFSMMFFIYFIAWFGYLQPKIFSGFSVRESVQSPQRYKNSALSTALSLEIVEQLKTHMANEKPYRDSDLRLEKLANQLNLSRHNLSQVINEQLNMSFFEYINYLRIQEATELLKSNSQKQLNILEVAFSVGFNNKVSFNITFKKITGKTPTEYRRTAIDQESALTPR